ncbi:MAG: hypothetical protein EXQ86_01495 [Rhodospirillales bacterium]|nr:hypothetical protein [Rhodospirillales bacterium]
MAQRSILVFVFGFLAALTAIFFFLSPNSALPKAALRLVVSAPVPPPGTAGKADRQQHPARTAPKPPPDPILLQAVLSRVNYDLKSVILGEERVPRVFVAGLPSILGDIQETQLRKDIFLKLVLPLVLRVNEEILLERHRLLALRHIQRLGGKLSAADTHWLQRLAARYGAPADDLDDLLDRVDMIPPSLAVAQAAKESGWGTSRFVREGNALFGQWIYADGHLVPLRRDEGKSHSVQSFKHLVESVRAYALNLNSNRHYREFRSLRARLRSQGLALEGVMLAGALTRYSGQGPVYVNRLRTLIRSNELWRLDGARLDLGAGSG